MSVENKQKINIAVNGIHAVSVESKAKINIGVNWANVVSVESFDSSEVNCCNGYCSSLYSTSKHCLLSFCLSSIVQLMFFTISAFHA